VAIYRAYLTIDESQPPIVCELQRDTLDSARLFVVIPGSLFVEKKEMNISIK
jgi:hypothetical protein